MQTPRHIRRLTALLLAGALLLTSCGGGAKATTMHLKRTQGQVDVADDKGKGLDPQDDLGLYSGYEVDTHPDSYAWIDLDEVKLTKMDENSEIQIQKDGKDLEIVVNEGSLFFNVTEPLADDETMTIRASSMMVGIRGTCGWVEIPDSGTMKVYLLEGKVECTAGAETANVTAGEMAAMTKDGDITVAEFTAWDIPGFVMEEVEDDSGLVEDILNASGLDVLHPVDPQDDIDRRAALLEVLDNNGGASYAGLFDLDQDGREDLLLLQKVGQYSGFRWTAYLWDGSEVRAVDLIRDTGVGTTDDIFTVTAGIYRERASGTPYVRYYGQVVGGAYSNYFINTTDSIEIHAPFLGGGGFDTEEEYAVWQQQKDQELREYEEDLADRFETIVELAMGGFDNVKVVDAEDYTYTIEEVRQQLTAG